MVNHLKRPLLEFSSKGIYCSKGNFYIDPWQPVNRALITHAHSDHAYWGHQSYLAQHASIPILRHRLERPGVQFYGINYEEMINLNGVKVSFHPAGHIIGSSQIRLEMEGQIWVVSGDYKLEKDGISVPFEPVKCHVFITESTFALPCFQWQPQQIIFDEINDWWRHNRSQGFSSILLGYALGKSQRLLKGLDFSIGSIYAHGAIWNMTEIIREQDPLLPSMAKVSSNIPKENFVGSMILAPTTILKNPWLNRFLPYRIGYASGWMSLRNVRRHKEIDIGFILSDHADWPALQQAIKATEAERIIVTHGFTAPLARWLVEQGYDAQEAKISYKEEEDQQEIE